MTVNHYNKGMRISSFLAVRVRVLSPAALTLAVAAIMAPRLSTAASPATPSKMQASPPASAQAGGLPAEAAILPAESEIVLYADVRLLRSPAGLLDMRRTIPIYPRAWRRLEDLLQAGGLNLEKDVDRFVMAARESGEAPALLVALTGRINAERFRSALTAKRWTREGEGAGALFVSPATPLPRAEGKEKRSERVAAAFPAKDTVIWGDRDWVVAALSARKGGNVLGGSGTTVGKLAADAAGRPAAAWLVAGTPRAARQTFRRLVPPAVAPLVETVAEVDTLLVTLQNPGSGKPLGIFSTSQAPGESQANLFAEGIRAAIAFARINPPSAPDGMAALDSVKVLQRGTVVEVSVEVPVGLIPVRGDSSGGPAPAVRAQSTSTQAK